MKLKILDIKGTEKGNIELPSQFQEPVRLDLVKRAVLAIKARNRQPYGAKPEAGKRASAYVSKRRRAYKGTYGIGQSRTPRKVLSRSGTRFNFVGAFAPQTVGGRRAHAPKASKIWTQKINTLENRKAIRSALSATIIPELVTARGHKIPANYPFIISEDFTNVKKTSELKKILLTLGFAEEFKRASVKKIRAGIGKTRGRKYKKRTSILFVTDKLCDLELSSSNLPGVEFCLAENLNADLLAPGTVPGRLTLYTESAIKKIAAENLFNKVKEIKAKEVKIKEAKKTSKTAEVKKVVKKTKKTENTKEDEQ